MLSLLANMTQVGLYTPAVSYVNIGDMAVLALTGAFFPIVSRTVHERKVSKKELSKYLGYFAGAGLVMLGVTYAFGGQLMIFAFGPKLSDGGERWAELDFDTSYGRFRCRICDDYIAESWCGSRHTYCTLRLETVTLSMTSE